MDWTEIIKLILAALAGGSVWKLIDVVSISLKRKGDHNISLVDQSRSIIDQVDRLRVEAVKERELALDQIDDLRTRIVELESETRQLDERNRKVTNELEISREAERKCNEQVTLLSDRLSLGANKFSEIESNLVQLKSRLRQLEGSKR